MLKKPDLMDFLPKQGESKPAQKPVVKTPEKKGVAELLGVSNKDQKAKQTKAIAGQRAIEKKKYDATARTVIIKTAYGAFDVDHKGELTPEKYKEYQGKIEKWAEGEGMKPKAGAVRPEMTHEAPKGMMEYALENPAVKAVAGVIDQANVPLPIIGQVPGLNLGNIREKVKDVTQSAQNSTQLSRGQKELAGLVGGFAESALDPVRGTVKDVGTAFYDENASPLEKLMAGASLVGRVAPVAAGVGKAGAALKAGESLGSAVGKGVAGAVESQIGTAPKQEASPLEKLMAESKVVPETPQLPKVEGWTPTEALNYADQASETPVTSFMAAEARRKRAITFSDQIIAEIQKQKSKVRPKSSDYRRLDILEKEIAKGVKSGEFHPLVDDMLNEYDAKMGLSAPAKQPVAPKPVQPEPPLVEPSIASQSIEPKLKEVKPTDPVPSVLTPEQARAQMAGTDPTSLQDAEAMANKLKPKPTPETPGVTTSARKAQVAEDRANMGLGELDDPVRKTWGTALDEADAKGYDGAWAMREAEKIKEKPRALSDTETAGMTKTMANLKNQHKSVLEQIANETDPAKLKDLKASLEGIEGQFDTVSEAVKLSGTEKGRALASQKLTLNEELDLISVKARAKAAKGEPLTAVETAKYDDLVKRLDEAEARIAQVENQNIDLQKVIDSMPTGARSGRRIARSQAEIKAARTDALAKWNKSVTSAPMGSGIDPTALDFKALGQYIATFAEEGVGKAEDVIRAAIAHAKSNGVEISEADAKRGLMEWGTPKKSTREYDKALYVRDRLRKEIRTAINEQSQTAWEKISREAMSLPRALTATGDMSATLRQGILLGAGNPAKAAAAFTKAFKATFDPVYAAKLERELHNTPQAVVRKKAKLYISEGETTSLAEEAFMSRLAEKIPGFGVLVKGSERNYTTFLNQLRASVFDDMVSKFPNMNIDEQKALADFINVATGRGRIGHDASKMLSPVLFSPRFVASRIQAPLDALMITKEGRAMYKSPAAKQQMLQSWGSLIGGGLTVMSLAKLAGGKAPDDPRDSDFGKVVIGNTRFDIWGGFAQPVRLAAMAAKQGFSGKKAGYGESTADATLKFLRYKLAPAPNIAFGAIDKEDAVGQPFLVGKNGKMTPATFTEDALKQFVPLLARDLAELWTDKSTPVKAKVAGTIVAPLGVGVNTYKKKSK